MSSTERHATRAEDWRVFAQNLAGETYYVGGQFADARRIMLSTWEGWTSGEPPHGEIVYELLATLWAMAMCSGVEGLGEFIEEFGAKVERAFPPTPNDEEED